MNLGERHGRGPDRPTPDGRAARGARATELVAIAPALKAIGVTALLVLMGMALFASLFAISFTGAAQPQVVCAGSPATVEIPAAYVRLYQETGQGFGLEWVMLAAIGAIETGHGRNMGPSSAGALGPMQFMPATWAAYGIDGDGDGRRDVMDPADAIPGAARLLRANGAPADWHRALFAYNHAGWYVRQVLAQAERYRGACAEAAPVEGDGQLAWPVTGTLTSPFCERRSWERCHPGIDIAVPKGTAVRAAERGTVTLARPVSGYGHFICVTHGPRLTTCYAHLQSYRVHMHEPVERGQVIALSGCTGRCFGPHLHFEVRRGPRFGAPVTDPRPYLGGSA